MLSVNSYTKIRCHQNQYFVKGSYLLVGKILTFTTPSWLNVNDQSQNYLKDSEDLFMYSQYYNRTINIAFENELNY